MAKKKASRTRAASVEQQLTPSCDTEQLLMAAMERDDDSLETGRHIISYADGAADHAGKAMRGMGMRIASSHDFTDQEIRAEELGDADGLFFEELGCAVVSSHAISEFGIESLSIQAAGDGAIIEAIEPEYFMFAEGTEEYMRGFLSAANTIARDIGAAPDEGTEEGEVDAEVLGSTWGLKVCRVPQSKYSGSKIRVAILDTGMDFGHPDFAKRKFTAKTFVGQHPQDGNGHGTHVTGTACGPKSPPGQIPRYGIGFNTEIFIGKVLTNSGGGTSASVLGGMNWAIACNCQVINLSLGAQIPPQSYYTNAGNAALKKGLLMIAAAGNAWCKPTGAPANSPSIMAVASLDQDCKPSAFSNCGKIEIAAPGRDIYSSWPRPKRYNTISGTSMASPHVAGCAALWAQSSSSLRGLTLWKKLTATAKKLPFPSAKVGAGLVQAP